VSHRGLRGIERFSVDVRLDPQRRRQTTCEGTDRYAERLKRLTRAS